MALSHYEYFEAAFDVPRLASYSLLPRPTLTNPRAGLHRKNGVAIYYRASGAPELSNMPSVQTYRADISNRHS